MRSGRRPLCLRACVLGVVSGLALGLVPAPVGADPLGQVTEVPVPSTNIVDHVVAGPDGAMWFTESENNMIGRVTLAGSFQEFGPTPPNPEEIVVGPDGNLWFASGDHNNDSQINRITTAGVITSFGDPTTIHHVAEGLALGPDNKLWFTEHDDNDGDGAIGRIDPLAADPTASITEFPIGSPSGEANPHGITVGSDGNMWFTRAPTGGPSSTLSAVDRILVAAPNTITEIALPSGAEPEGITTGADGNLWFIEPFNGTGAIGRMDPRAADPSTTLTQFTTGMTNAADPDGIALGCDGNLWFTEGGSDPTPPGAIGRITVDGTITEYPTPTALSSPAGIGASQPGDPNMWFGESPEAPGQIGRIGVGSCLSAAPTLTARFTG